MWYDVLEEKETFTCQVDHKAWCLDRVDIKLLLAK